MAARKKTRSSISDFFWLRFGGLLLPASKPREERREGNLLDLLYWLSLLAAGFGLAGFIIAVAVGGGSAALLFLFCVGWSLLWAALWKAAVNSSEAKYQHRKKLEAQLEGRQSLEAQQAALLAQQQAFLIQQQEWLASQQAAQKEEEGEAKVG